MCKGDKTYFEFFFFLVVISEAVTDLSTMPDIGSFKPNDNLWKISDNNLTSDMALWAEPIKGSLKCSRRAWRESPEEIVDPVEKINIKSSENARNISNASMHVQKCQ